jgi:aspartyl-tRNA(Asn)/glutamyl-tRNA(Gln) amidotransferase subunit C
MIKCYRHQFTPIQSGALLKMKSIISFQSRIHRHSRLLLHHDSQQCTATKQPFNGLVGTSRRFFSDSQASRIFQAFSERPSKWSTKSLLKEPSEISASDEVVAIDVATVQHMAMLSRLHIPADKVQQSQKDFQAMIRLISHVREVDTTDVEPMLSVLQDRVHSTPERVDEVDERTISSNDDAKNTAIESAAVSERTEKQMDHILQHAPQKMRRFFITPQVKD